MFLIFLIAEFSQEILKFQNSENELNQSQMMKGSRDLNSVALKTAEILSIVRFKQKFIFLQVKRISYLL
jgi:hypothetical protein